MEPFSLFPNRLFEQDFGMCITPEDLILPTNNICTPNYIRPWKWYIPNIPKDCGSTIENDKDKFQVALDVQHFKPSEISVKVLNKQIIIEGDHEERLDEHGMVSRKFTRRYALPRDCDADDVTSNLSSDGVLTVIANKKCNQNLNKEISVPIKLCDSFSKQKVQSSFKSDQLVGKTSTAAEERCDILKNDSEETCTKNKSQLMLREDKCCLLKPELFMQSKTSAEDTILETKADMQELSKMRTEKFEGIISDIATKTDETMKLTMDNIGQRSVASTTYESVIEETMKGTVSSPKEDSIKTTARSGKEDSMASFRESLDETMKCSIASTLDESAKSTFGSGKAESMKSFKESALDETMKSSIASTMDDSIKSTTASANETSTKSFMESTLDESMKCSVASTIGESIKSTIASTMDDFIKSTTATANETSIKSFMESTLAETMECSIASTKDEFTKSSVASALDESIKIAAAVAGMSSTSAASEMTSHSSETMQAEEFSSSFMTTMSSNIKPNEKSSELFTDTITAALKEAAENM